MHSATIEESHEEDDAPFLNHDLMDIRTHIEICMLVMMMIYGHIEIYMLVQHSIGSRSYIHEYDILESK
jgi:hypothetical protein